MQKQKLHHFSNRSSPNNIHNRTKRITDTFNYRQYIIQFQPNTRKGIRQYERKKICRQKKSIMSSLSCINEAMLPKYTYFNLLILWRDKLHSVRITSIHVISHSSNSQTQTFLCSLQLILT